MVGANQVQLKDSNGALLALRRLLLPRAPQGFHRRLEQAAVPRLVDRRRLLRRRVVVDDWEPKVHDAIFDHGCR